MTGTMNLHHQKCIFKARAWSHVHVGCGKDVGRWEYFFANDNKQLAFLDYDRLATEAMVNETLIDEMTVAAGKDPGGSLHKFLRKYDLEDSELRSRLYNDSGLRSLPVSLQNVDPDARHIRRIRLFNGSPRCYVSGSSIKGAIRTAYMSSIIDESKSKSEILPRDPAADDFTNLRMLRERLSKNFRPGTDDTRLFQNFIVRDSEALNPSEMGIASIALYGGGNVDAKKHNEKKAGKVSDEYAEVLLGKSEFRIEALLRTSGRLQAPIKDCRSLMERADKFFRRVWEEELQTQIELKKSGKEKADLIEFYENERVSEEFYLVRLGYGAGQMANSLLLDYRDYYADTLPDSADEPLRHSFLYTRKRTDLKKRKPYPFTARSALAADLDKWRPLGWIALSKDVEIE